MTIDPRIWGPYVWKTIDLFIQDLPDEGPFTKIKQEYILMFFISLMELLPCDECKTHYNEYFYKHLLENELQYPDSKKRIRIWVDNLKQEIHQQIPYSKICRNCQKR